MEGIVSSTSAVHHCVGVLLAAGEGLRYRAARHALRDAAHKLLARLPDGRPVAQASASTLLAALPDTIAVVADRPPELPALLDRKSVVEGKRVSVRVDLGGRRIIKKKNYK